MTTGEEPGTHRRPPRPAGADDLPLSVVIATVDPWPAVAAVLESVLAQTEAVGGEVVIADGHGQGLPDGAEYPSVVTVRRPGASIFQARASGLARARGRIVAVTEDHCRVAPDWCEAVLAAFDGEPGTMVVGGAVENGAAATLLDQMHFLIANGPSMRPLGRAGPRSMSGQANVSYRREVLAGADTGHGVLQMQLNRDLGRAGVAMKLDGRPLVWHDQHLDLGGALRLHFHNGRCIAGFRRPRLGVAAWVARLASCAVLPAYLAARAVAIAWRKGRLRLRSALGLPLLVLLGWSHAAGELVGYLSGLGDSPRHMR